VRLQLTEAVIHSAHPGQRVFQFRPFFHYSINCATVLFFQAVQAVETLSDLFKTVGVVTDPIAVTLQRVGHFIEHDLDLAALHTQLFECGVDAGQFEQLAVRRAELFGNRALAFVQPLKQLPAASKETFGILQNAFFALQRLFLAGLRVKGIDLLELKPAEFARFGHPRRTLFQLSDFNFHLLQVVVAALDIIGDTGRAGVLVE